MVKRLFLASFALIIGLCAGKEAPESIIPLNEVITNGLSDIPELRPMDVKVDSFMRFWDIKGASLSIIRNDSLVYAKGYGWAEKEKGVRMTPGHTLRMASVSKLITAAGIMVLQEQGRLNLQTPVFGPYGILDEYDSYIRDDNMYMITVEHLLRHQSGFTSRGGDPMFSTRTIMSRYGLSSPPDATTLTRKLLGGTLDFVPGSSQSYSNFGYLLLSMIIEKVSGQSYEEFIKKEVLEKSGCYAFHIANNYYSGKYDDETKYYMQPDSDTVPDYSGAGYNVVRCYGGNDIRALSGAGAWVGSTVELARFVASIDGRMVVPDIITPFSVYQMTQYFDEDTFGLGWLDTNTDGEWTRTGSFSGTSALIRYYPDGECWIFITNTSTWKGSRFTKDTAGFFKHLRHHFSPLLPKRDMFESR